MTSSLDQAVKPPHRRKLATYAGQFVTLLRLQQF